MKRFVQFELGLLLGARCTHQAASTEDFTQAASDALPSSY
jgi:hypothetical protein